MTEVVGRFSVDCRIVTDGFVGGNYEYAPYLMSHASFGAYRTQLRDDLVEEERSTKTFMKKMMGSLKRSQLHYGRSLGADGDDEEESEEEEVPDETTRIR